MVAETNTLFESSTHEISLTQTLELVTLKITILTADQTHRGFLFPTRLYPQSLERPVNVYP